MSAGAASIRRCRADERADILRIVNAAAEAYRGVIPADRWREPDMPGDELDAEWAAAEWADPFLRAPRLCRPRSGHAGPKRAAGSSLLGVVLERDPQADPVVEDGSVLDGEVLPDDLRDAQFAHALGRCLDRGARGGL